MAKFKGAWGIDVGQCALKAIRLELVGDQVTATAFDYVEHPKILSQPDADADQLTREALDTFVKRNNLKGDRVVVGVSGQSGLVRFVKLPPVEEKKINDIVRFEAKQQIPFPLDEVIWDYQKIGSGVVTDGFAMETEIGLFAMKRDLVQRSLQYFLDAKIEVHVVQMTPLALCNYSAFDLLGKGNAAGPAVAPLDETATSTGIKERDAGFKKRCVVALDIGADSSNLVVTDGDRVIWQRAIPVGGNHFTRALTKELKLTFAKAEHLKRNATKSPDLRRILAALKPVLNEFVGEVQRSLGFFTNTNREAHVEYLIGLGSAFRLPGMQKFLAEKLALEVKRLEKFHRLHGDAVVQAPTFANNVLSFPVAYGLALQGLNVARLETSLLPQEIRFEREVKGKKPWAAAAAAALLVGVTASAVGYAMQYRAVAGENILKKVQDASALAERARTSASTFEAKKAQVQQVENAVKSILAGTEERLNWILLNRFVNDCLPVPAHRVDGKVKSMADGRCVVIGRDGTEHTVKIDADTRAIVNGEYVVASRVPGGTEASFVYQTAPETLKFWRQEGADKAYLQYWKRQNAGKGGQAQADDEGVDLLIQVNLESVLPMFTPSVDTFFRRVQEEKEKNKDILAADMAETIHGKKNLEPAVPPKPGPGWIVELRGYTYHQGARTFVRKTLLQNLAEGAARDEAKPATPPPPAPPPSSNGPTAPTPIPGGPTPGATPGPAETDPFEQAIANRVSHVVMFASKSIPNAVGDNFQLIGSSPLGALLSASPDAATRPRGTLSNLGAGGAATALANWQPLGGATIATGAKALAIGPSSGETEPGKRPPNLDGPKAFTRTEFIIYFIWREPTPSDDRMGATPGAPGAPPVLGGPAGPPPGVPPAGPPPQGAP